MAFPNEVSKPSSSAVNYYGKQPLHMHALRASGTTIHTAYQLVNTSTRPRLVLCLSCELLQCGDDLQCL